MSASSATNETLRTAPFNKGASVPDTEALGPGGESIAKWRQDRGIDVSLQIRVKRLVHMRYQHPDLEAITAFLLDFGMQIAHRTVDRIWFSGYGVDQYVYYAQAGPKKFLGGTFEVEEYDDLTQAAKLEGAQGITELSDAPGGGHMVTLHDAEGQPIHMIHGQHLRPELSRKREPLLVNYEVDKPRQRKFQRFEPGPAGVHKLGHYGLCVKDFAKQLDWYTRHFNFAPTDILYVPSDDGSTRTDVAVFAHIDRGEELVDHHTIFLSTSDSSHVHHCSFEVHDFDTQQLGHQWLADKGYQSVWGVGRHILGSQIFDYWWDTTGNMIEHYADGDLVDNGTPIGRLPAGHASLAVWGPDVPTEFLG